MALRGCEFVPRSNALISGEVMNKRYNESWKSERPQKTTCSYLTGTAIVFGVVRMEVISMKMDKVKERTVFGQKVISPPDDEWHDERRELFQFLLALSFHTVGRVCVSPANDRVLEVLPEVTFGTQIVRVCEVEEREVF